LDADSIGLADPDFKSIQDFKSRSGSKLRKILGTFGIILDLQTSQIFVFSHTAPQLFAWIPYGTVGKWYGLAVPDPDPDIVCMV
jgi:hypothetical protein